MAITEGKLNIREKVIDRLNRLEALLGEGRHISDGNGREEITDLIHGIAKYYSILSDEDRDFLNAARLSVKERLPWV